MNLLLAELPGATTRFKFSNSELKMILYQSVINQWKANFTNSGRNVHDTTLEELKRYMVIQEM